MTNERADFITVNTVSGKCDKLSQEKGDLLLSNSANYVINSFSDFPGRRHVAFLSKISYDPLHDRSSVGLLGPSTSIL
jgi:hypothetical protein